MKLKLRGTSPMRIPVPALAAFALLILTLPAAAPAQQAPQNQPPSLVSFKATMAGGWDGLLIPLAPPIVSDRLSATGQADLLGQFTFVGHHFAHLGVDGTPLSFDDGVGVLTAANGDALFMRWSGLFGSGGTDVDFPFTVTGGRGRFAGATGSGVIHDVIKRTAVISKLEFVRTVEGTITAPKP